MSGTAGECSHVVGSNKGRRGFFEVGKNSGKTKSGVEMLQRTRRGYAQGPAAQQWIGKAKSIQKVLSFFAFLLFVRFFLVAKR